MEHQGELILTSGSILVLMGLTIWIFGDKLPWLGKLPGDIQIKRSNFSFSIPIATMLLLSGIFGLGLLAVERLTTN